MLTCVASAGHPESPSPASFPTFPSSLVLVEQPTPGKHTLTCGGSANIHVSHQLPLRPPPAQVTAHGPALPPRLATLLGRRSALPAPHLPAPRITRLEARRPHGTASNRVVFKTSSYTQEIVQLSHFYSQSLLGGTVEREVVVLKHTEIKENICCSEFSQYTVSYI